MPVGETESPESADRMAARSLRIYRGRQEDPRGHARDTVDMAKRSYGTGSLYTVRDGRGREIWYGRWWVGGQRIKRRLGLKRPAGSRDGLTRTQAERALQRLIDSEVRAVPEVRVGVREVGAQLIEHLESLGRKRSTVEEYRSYLAVHLAPFFGDADIDKISPARIEAFIAAKRRDGAATKSILNYLGLLHSIFEFAVRRGSRDHQPVQARRQAGAPRPGAGHPLSRRRRARRAPCRRSSTTRAVRPSVRCISPPP